MAEVEAKDVVYPATPYWPVEIEPGMNAFFRPTLELHFKAGEHWSGDLPASIVDAFKIGHDRNTQFGLAMQKIAHDFCFAFVTKFMEAGFRIGWFFVARKVVLKDGRSVGPGFAVYLLRPRKNEGKEAKRDLRAQEAIALGNAMKFCQDGVRVSIKELEVGIVCGGPIDEALLEHELGEDRLLSEHLGLGAELARREIGELERLCTRLESIQKEWKFGLSEEEQENWQEHLGKLKSQVKRRIKMAQVLDDAEVWMTAQEEVEQACPAFKRKAEQEKWEVFRRIRVRLGLLEDE